MRQSQSKSRRKTRRHRRDWVDHRLGCLQPQRVAMLLLFVLRSHIYIVICANRMMNGFGVSASENAMSQPISRDLLISAAVSLPLSHRKSDKLGHFISIRIRDKFRVVLFLCDEKLRQDFYLPTNDQIDIDFYFRCWSHSNSSERN